MNRNRLLAASCGILLMTLPTAALLSPSPAGMPPEPLAGNADLEAATAAYRDYRFEAAKRSLAAASKQRNKLSEEDTELLEETRRRLADAEGFLERVEKITIIDSIAVDADTFFKAYRLPGSAGVLLPPDSIPFPMRRGEATTAFANENRDFMMWAEADSTGYTRLAESILLTDGSWSRPVLAPEELSEDGDADFPFMMADGTTLYYASDGEGSIGGLDIFVATRDASTGEYLQPRNMGMPYNSPFDDYMLAIDELNGIGWWATDRNRLDDKVTVYVFLVNEMRENYPTDELDDETLIDYARIRDFRDTWETPDSPGERGEEALAAIKAISNEPDRRKADFTFRAHGGKKYSYFTDLPDENSRKLMRDYLSVKKEHEDLTAELDRKRREYHSSRSKTLGSEIQRLERSETELAARMKEARNQLYQSIK